MTPVCPQSLSPAVQLPGVAGTVLGAVPPSAQTEQGVWALEPAAVGS